MKWLTKEEVRAYATTPDRALDISIKHHQQVVDATEEELKEYGGELLDDYLCGLCHYYSVLGNGRCKACPLDKDGGRCGNLGSLWRNAGQAFINHPFNHKAFIKAETALLNRLKQLKSGDKSMKKEEIEIRIKQAKEGRTVIDEKIEALQSELAACAKPELRHGDYGYIDEPSIKSMYFIDNHFAGSPKHPHGISNSGGQCDMDKRNFLALGNIFDDLARNAEPLEEFEASNNCGNREIKVTLVRNRVHLWINDHHGEDKIIILEMPVYAEFCKQANQLLAEAKRKAADNG